MKNQSNIASQIWIALLTAYMNCIYAMEAAAPVRARHSVGFVCEACCKKIASSAGFDRHRTCGYLRGTACYVGDDGSTKFQLVATKRNNMSTASLEKRKMLGRKRGTLAAYM